MRISDWSSDVCSSYLLRLNGRDRTPGIGTRAEDDHAASDLAFAVQFGNAAPHLGADLDRGDIAKPHRHPACRCLQWNAAEVVERFQIAGRADHIFGFAELKQNGRESCGERVCQSV